MRPEYIIIHHSLTSDGREVSWNAIRNYHMNWKYEGNIITRDEAYKLIGQGVKGIQPPWRNIGYHGGIELVGDRYEFFMGRVWDEPGAHCPKDGMNGKSLGICFVGNFDNNAVHDEQWNLGITVLRFIKRLYNIQTNKIYGHGEWSHDKTCPGTKFDMNRLRSSLS